MQVRMEHNTCGSQRTNLRVPPSVWLRHGLSYCLSLDVYTSGATYKLLNDPVSSIPPSISCQRVLELQISVIVSNLFCGFRGSTSCPYVFMESIFIYYYCR